MRLATAADEHPAVWQQRGRVAVSGVLIEPVSDQVSSTRIVDLHVGNLRVANASVKPPLTSTRPSDSNVAVW